MKNLDKYVYDLETLSTVILSPRDSRGFYLDAGDFQKDDINSCDGINSDKVKIIYPFYQYGSYTRYKPEDTQYYIPGSSVKGAICMGLPKGKDPKLMVDDLSVGSDSLRLFILQKVQGISLVHMADGKKPSVTLDPFFPNVAVEMLGGNTICKGELFCGKEIYSYLEEAQKRTEKKLVQMRTKVDDICKSDRDINDACRIVLEIFQKKIDCLLHQVKNQKENTYMILMGGYKGALLSGVFGEDDFPSAIYIDKESNLPHGIVNITLEVKE